MNVISESIRDCADIYIKRELLLLLLLLKKANEKSGWGKFEGRFGKQRSRVFGLNIRFDVSGILKFILSLTSVRLSILVFVASLYQTNSNQHNNSQECYSYNWNPYPESGDKDVDSWIVLCVIILIRRKFFREFKCLFIYILLLITWSLSVF